MNLYKNPVPPKYPEEWNVPFVKSQPLKDFAEPLKRETLIYKAGTTNPPLEKPLSVDVRREKDIAITLRDGTVIYTDVLMPASATGPFPAIVAWSPYGKGMPGGRMPGAPQLGIPSVPNDSISGFQKFEGPDAAFWAGKGYAIVNPDARGAWNSGGNLHGWGSVQAGDCYDLIEWVAKQEWCTGKVGMAGNSWLSATQWGVASLNPPSLKAWAPWNGISDLFRDHVMWGGIPDDTILKRFPASLIGLHETEDFATGALRVHPFMSPYWADKRPPVEQSTAPVYVMADIATVFHTAGTLGAWRRLPQENKWLRTNKTNEWFDQYRPENEDDLCRFFDFYLKGEDNGWETTPAVRTDIMDPTTTDPDAGTSRTAFTAFPVANTEYRKLYLDASGAALGLEAPAPSATRYDAVRGEAVYTMRFEEDVQLIGYSMARLFVEAQGADDMDVFLMIEKIGADGTPLKTNSRGFAFKPIPQVPGPVGRLRVSMRELDPELSTPFNPVYSLRSPKKITPGDIVSIDVAILPTAMRWHRGESLRLTVCGHYVAPFPPTLNAGSHVIHTGGDRASYLQLPFVTWEN